MLPQNAQPIVDARKRGQKPALPVFVCLACDTAGFFENHAVRVPSSIPIERLDWSWCVGLDVEIVTRERLVGNERVVAAIQAVAEARPMNLVVWETVTGSRWWIVGPLGMPWPKPYRMREWDPRFVAAEEEADAARA